MRVMRALEVRAKFGEVIDAAAAGERIVVERAGHPVAAIVPLTDLDAHDPEKITQRRLEAIERIKRMKRRLPRSDEPFDAAAAVRWDRDHGHGPWG